MGNLSYHVRRKGVILGMFSDRELASLLHSNRLTKDDEVLVGQSWILLRDHPVCSTSEPSALAQQVQAAPQSADRKSCYIHFKGQRLGPLETSKLTAMFNAGLIDTTARVELLGSAASFVSISEYLGLTAISPIQAIGTPASPPSGTPLPVSAPPAIPQASLPRRASYLSIWWKTALVIYLLSVLLGFLAYGLHGMAYAMGAGIIAAPIKGAFIGWLIWLFRS